MKELFVLMLPLSSGKKVGAKSIADASTVHVCSLFSTAQTILHEKYLYAVSVKSAIRYQHKRLEKTYSEIKSEFFFLYSLTIL